MIFDLDASESESYVLKNEIPPERTEKAFFDIYQYVAAAINDGTCEKEKTLFLFDIDDTVLTRVNHQLVALRSSGIVINDLQTQLGISTSALTSRPALNESEERLLSNIKGTQRELGKIGIEFTTGPDIFKTAEVLHNQTGEKRQANGFFRLDSEEPYDLHELYKKPNPPLRDFLYYGDGVIMTSYHDKGDALVRFLELKQLKDHFNCFFFVDDLSENTESVARALSRDNGRHIYVFHLPSKK